MTGRSSTSKSDTKTRQRERITIKTSQTDRQTSIRKAHFTSCYLSYPPFAQVHIIFVLLVLSFPFHTLIFLPLPFCFFLSPLLHVCLAICQYFCPSFLSVVSSFLPFSLPYSESMKRDEEKAKDRGRREQNIDMQKDGRKKARTRITLDRRTGSRRNEKKESHVVRN